MPIIQVEHIQKINIFSFETFGLILKGSAWVQVYKEHIQKFGKWRQKIHGDFWISILALVFNLT